MLRSCHCSRAAVGDEDDSPIVFITVVVRYGTASPPHFTNSPLHCHPTAPSYTVSLASLLCSQPCTRHGHRCGLPTWEAQRLCVWPPNSAALAPTRTRASRGLTEPLMLGNTGALRKHPSVLTMARARQRRGHSTRTKPIEIRSLPRRAFLAEKHSSC